MYRKVDSLKTDVGQSMFINYFNDTSRILKFYAIGELLNVNNDAAFLQLSRVVRDSVKVDYEFAGQNRGSANFNGLLAYQYHRFIKWKYYEGGGMHADGVTNGVVIRPAVPNL